MRNLQHMQAVKKIIVFVPVLITGVFYAYSQHFHQLHRASDKRLIFLVVSVLLFYAWALTGIIKRKQESFFDVLLQSSFYVYAFAVLTLTGYFFLFNSVSSHNWWQGMMHRWDTNYGVNLKPFIFLRPGRLFTYNVVGNFFMLMPLGIYLPLLYKYTKNFFTATFVAMMVSISIELMQLASNFRVTDIDDVILNTAGAAVGFIIYLVFYGLIIKPLFRPQQPLPAYARR
ncbi:MAG: VanZ family protein [Chitinophagaceae bacterium]